MNISAPVLNLGKTLGVAAGLGAATYFGEKALLGHTQGKPHSAINTAVLVAGIIGVGAFWIMPGLPNKTLASAALLGLAGASLIAHEK